MMIESWLSKNSIFFLAKNYWKYQILKGWHCYFGTKIQTNLGLRQDEFLAWKRKFKIPLTIVFSNAWKRTVCKAKLVCGIGNTTYIFWRQVIISVRALKRSKEAKRSEDIVNTSKKLHDSKMNCCWDRPPGLLGIWG